MNTTTQTETPLYVPCAKCAGKGVIHAFKHYAAGECFDCHGAGGTWTTEEREERLARRRAEDRMRRARKAEDKRAKMDAAEAEFLAEHDGLAEALATDHHITADLADTLRASGSLSDKQVALAHKIAADVAERAAELAARPMEPVVEGRGPVSGEVVSVKWEDNSFNPNGGMVCKIVVADERGFRLYGTAPAAIREDLERGARVAFTATLAAKEAGFGFFSRATKAQLL